MAKLIMVLISWLRMSPLSLAAFGRRTVSFMQPLLLFATPTVSYEDMLAACLRVETAWANRDNGPVAARELKNAIAALDVLLHDQAKFVDTKALGSVTVIISSGFDHTAAAGTPAVHPDAPAAPELTPLGSGKMLVTVPHQNGVKNNVIVVFLGAPFPLIVIDNHFVIPKGSDGVMIMPIVHTHEQISLSLIHI